MARAKKKKSEYRSSMEARIVPPLLARGAQYEPVYLHYQAPARRYIPDVTLDNGIAIEIKGWFKPADRSKMLAVKLAHPGLDIRMVLASPTKTLSKASKTTEAAWCEQHGIPWAKDNVPESWLLESVNFESWKILHTADRLKKTKKAA